MASFKSLLPRGLYGRAALILVVPIVTIQLVVSAAFIQRHFDRVTQQLTAGVVAEVRLLLQALERDGAGAELARFLPPDLRVERPAPPDAPRADRHDWTDLTGPVVLARLRAGLPELVAADLSDESRGGVALTLQVGGGEMLLVVPRARLSASNPHQLLVIMLVTSVLMTVIAYAFLRNQLRPIAKLAEAAEAFGKGKHVSYKPRGAQEVRAAGAAFLDMRARIERQIEQRTLLLSGVSHDLRTPLTRLRLGLAMLPEDAETAALLEDVAQMERLVDEFLAFSRGDAREAPQPADPAALMRAVVERMARAGVPVRLVRAEGAGTVHLRPQAIERALENLIANAGRFGTRVEVGLTAGADSLRFTVEDDGPGIPPGRREEALRPFTRLDAARDPNLGGGVGLGLSIAADIARSHGGRLVLGESAGLGGLRADLLIAR